MSTTLPKQKVSQSVKNTEEWQKGCLDYYERMSWSNSTGMRTSNARKLINYDLFNGRFNKADLEYVCNPLGLDNEQFPATLQYYDIITPALMLLIGEEASRPDNTIVVSEGEDVVNRKAEATKQKLLALLEEQLMAEIDPSTIDPNNPPPTPDEILKYQRYNTSDIIESKANQLLKVLKKKLNTKNIFNRGWKDALIAGEEIYWIGQVTGEPVIRKCNPPDIGVILNGNSDFIDDAIAVIETRVMTVPSIIDEFGDELSNSQIEELEDMANNWFSNTNTSSANPVFQVSKDGIVDTGAGVSANNIDYGDHIIKVVRVEWISMKKIGTVQYIDEQGIPQELPVDETFKLNEFKEAYPEATVEWYWVNTAWEGTKIGEDIYIGVKEKENQRRRMDNPYYCRLGYSGLIYNATNSVSVSLIDRLKPYAYLYIILMYRLELAFASDMGRVFLMDLAQIPRSEGIDVTKWMYYLKAMKIGFINSFEEGKGKFTGQRSNFNQFQSIDMTLANTIQQYINSLEFIKQQVAYLSGISPQRLGSIQSKELVGNVERSVNQSALITEHWFDAHQEVKKRVYTALIEVAKIAYTKGYVNQYVNDDLSFEMINIVAGEFENSDFSVFVSDSSKDNQVIQELKSLFQVALQSDKVALSDIARILETNSVADIKHLLKRSEEEYAQRQSEAQKMQTEQAQAELEFQHNIEMQKLELEVEKLDREDINKDLDRQNDIELATIKAMGYAEDTDVNQNMIPDVIEQQRVALEHNKLANDIAFKEKELKHKQDTENQKINLEKEKLNAQKEIEKLKIKQTEIQNRSQEKIAKEANRLKEKEIQVKKIQARKKPSK